MSVPSLESLLAQHAVKYVEINDVAVCMCGDRFHDDTSAYDQPEGVMSHSEHQASVIREHFHVYGKYTPSMSEESGVPADGSEVQQ